MIRVRPLTAEDLPGVAACARQADIDELRDGAGQSIEQALRDGLRYSVRCALIETDEGVPLAAFGDACHSPAASVGVPWLISTTHIERHARGFLRVCKPLVADMLKRHQVLTNFVDARNLAAIRWLEWLGFEISSPMPAGIYGLPFRQFTLVRGHD